MKRSIEEILIQWKGAGRRKPLIVRGGHQVGKTWSIETFGQHHFQNTLKVDLENALTCMPFFQMTSAALKGLSSIVGPMPNG